MKIAVIGKRMESAVTYYRATAPIAELCRVNGWQMAVFMPRELTSDVMNYFDVVFLHRPIDPAEVEIIWKAKQIGVKSWVDIDDLLWKIPIANPAVTMFSPKDRTELLKAMINADVVSCSTEALKEAIYIEYDRNAIILPNAFNDRNNHMDEVIPFNVKAERKQILYRGSNTHDGDLYHHRKAFRPYGTIDFSFMGALPWYFSKQYGGSLDIIRHESWTNDILSYFARIREINPHFFIVPLEDNEFNRAKSNIAALEATEAGAVTIYPSYLPEFAKFPGIPYNSEQHLCEVLKEIDKADLSIFQPVHEAAVQYVRDNLRLSQINMIREAIVKEIVWADEEQSVRGRGDVNL